MEKLRRVVVCGAMLLALAAMASVTGWSPAEEPKDQNALRQVSTMAKVLEAALREELGGDIVGGSIFQPGGVRGFRVPGVGVVFQINVNFPVAEEKSSEKPATPESDDLWNRMERGGGAGMGGGVGMGGAGYGVVQPHAPSAPGAVPHPVAPTAPVPPGAIVPGAPPAATPFPPAGFSVEAPVPPGALPHVAATVGGMSASVAVPAPPQPHPYGAPVSVQATTGYGGYGGAHVGSSGDWRRKTESMERVILETLARYGERMKTIGPDENIIILVSGAGARGIGHMTRSISISTPRLPGLPSTGVNVEVNLEEMEKHIEEMGKRMEAAGEEMGKLGEEMGEMGREMAEAKAKNDERAQKEAEAKMKRTEEKMKAVAEKMKTMEVKMKDQDVPKIRVLAERERQKAIAAAVEADRTQARLMRDRMRELDHQVQVSMVGGGTTSWVLKVKKGDLTSNVDDLRKRVEIQSYAGAGDVNPVAVADPGSDDLNVGF